MYSKYTWGCYILYYISLCTVLFVIPIGWLQLQVKSKPAPYLFKNIITGITEFAQKDTIGVSIPKYDWVKYSDIVIID